MKKVFEFTAAADKVKNRKSWAIINLLLLVSITITF